MDMSNASSPPDLSEKGIITAIVSIIEHNGAVLLVDLGGLLGATLGPDATKVVKKEFKGLKHLLEKHSTLFSVSGKAPLFQVKLTKQPTSKAQATPASKAAHTPATISGAKTPLPKNAKEGATLLKQYVADLKTHITKGAWKQVGKLLRIRKSPISSSLSKCVGCAPNNPNALSSEFQSIIDNALGEVEEVDWARVASLHILACCNYYSSNYKVAVSIQTEVTKCFDTYWRGYAGNNDFNPKKQSPMDAWRVLLFEARQIAVWADLSLESAGNEANLLLGFQNYLRPLAKVFEKTPGLLLLQNTILRIYTHVRPPNPV